MPKFAAQVDLMSVPVKGLVVEPGNAFPVSPVEGQLFHRTDQNKVYVYLNSTWVDITAIATTLAASNVTYEGSANLSANNVEAALDELDAEKSPIAGSGLIQTVGTITSGTWNGSPIEVGYGGTGANNAVNARNNLGIASDADAGTPSMRSLGTGNLQAMPGPTRLDQISAPIASVNLSGQKITNLATPTADADAANKGYVDALVQGVSPKDSVRVATTANVDLATVTVIDTVTLANGDRVLVKNQTNATQNGIYVYNAGTGLTRAPDADSGPDLASAFVWVEVGATNADTGWLQTSDNIAIGGSSINWTQFAGLGQLVAGTGLTKTGNSIDVIGTANRITANADSVDIASNYAGQTSITTLGTVTTGTWSATTIAVNKGGTGATDAATARTNLGIPTDGSAATASMRTLGTGATQAAAGNHGHALTDAAITGTLAVNKGGTGATTAVQARFSLQAAGGSGLLISTALTAGVWTGNIAHSFNTTFVGLQFIEVDTGEQVFLDYKIIDAANFRIKSDVGYAANKINCVILAANG